MEFIKFFSKNQNTDEINRLKGIIKWECENIIEARKCFKPLKKYLINV